MGERSGKTLLGLILLIVGALLLLELFFGIDLGDIIAFAIPLVLMFYGARQVLKHGSSKRMWGAVVFLFGLLMLIGKLELFFGSLLALALLYFGVRQLRRGSMEDDLPSYAERQWAKAVLSDDTLDRWEREHTRKM